MYVKPKITNFISKRIKQKNLKFRCMYFYYYQLITLVKMINKYIKMLQVLGGWIKNNFYFIKRKNRNTQSLLPLKYRVLTMKGTNRVLSMKGIVFAVQVTLVNSKVMPTLDGINIKIQLRAQNHQNTLEATSTTFTLTVIPRPGRT